MPRKNKPYWHETRRQWRLRVRGKDHWLPRETYGPDNEAAAWVALHALLRPEATTPGPPGATDPDAPPTLDELRQDYLRWAEAEAGKGGGAMGKAQYGNHRTRLRRFVAVAGPDRDAAGFTVADMERVVAALLAGGYKVHYVRNINASAQAMFNWAASPQRVDGKPETILACNPVAGYRPPPVPESPDRYLDRTVARRFLRWAWGRARHHRERHIRRFDRIFLLMLRFIATTGCRPKEACRARWDQVNWRQRYIELQEWKNSGSTGRLRRIDLIPDMVRLLRALERLPGRHPEWIFTHAWPTRWGRVADGQDPTHGEPWPGATSKGYKIRKLRKAAIAAGLPLEATGPRRFVLYMFRHTYVTDGLHAGATLADMAELTGTSAELIEKTYGHMQRDHLRAKAEAIAAIRRRRGQGTS